MSKTIAEIHDGLKEIHEARFGYHLPHPNQILIHASPARFRAAKCGRRFGKTQTGVNEAAKDMHNHPGHKGCWVAPTFALTRKGWREFIQFCPRELIANVLKSEYRIEFHNGSWIEFKSADNPESLISEGYDFVIVDECARVARDAWEFSLRPALTDRLGWALFLTTPKGKNWFHSVVWARCVDPTETDWHGFSFATADNPFIDPAEIEEAKRTLPDVVFRQEYLAEFIDDAGAVFRNIRACIDGEYEEPNGGREYVMGTDLAKTQDFTVSYVVDRLRRKVVAFDRFQHISYDMAIPRVAELSRRYNNAEILLDSTGVGEPVFDMLRTVGARCQGYKFTNPSKEALIRGLMLALENKEITYPEEEVLISELECFEYKTGSTGLIRYGAPEGMHDDCVIALALAVHAARGQSSALLDWFKETTKEPYHAEDSLIAQLRVQGLANV